MKVRAAGGAVCAALTIASASTPPATAGDGAEQTGDYTGVVLRDSRLRTALHAAGRYWGLEPSKVSRVALRSFDDFNPGVIARGGRDAVGRGVIYLDRGWLRTLRQSPELRCVILVHELGHVLGYEHTTGMTDPMNPDAADVWVPPCRDYVRRKGKAMPRSRAVTGRATLE